MNIITAHISTPRKKEILFFLSHNGRKTIDSYLDLWITVISFFTIGTLSFLLYKYFINSPFFNLILISAILVLINFCFSFLLIGRLKISALSHGIESKKERLPIFFIWIISTTILSGLIPISLVKELKNIEILLLSFLYFNLLVSIVLGTWLWWRVKILENLKTMTTEINSFIDEHELLINSLEFIRNKLIKIHNSLTNKDREFDTLQSLLLQQIIKIMSINSFPTKYLNVSPIHNFVVFGVWSSTPLCAIACQKKIIDVIKHELTVLEKNKLLLHLQYLTSSGSIADIGINCERTSKNLRLCCRIDKYFYKRITDDEKELFIKLNVLESNGAILESITIDHQNLLWVQL